MKRSLGSLSVLTVAASALLVPVEAVTADGLVYGYNMRGTREFISWDISDPGGTMTVIGSPVPWRSYAMDFDLNADNLYVLENDVNPFGASNAIATVDLATGSLSYIAQITGAAQGLSLGGMAISPDGNVYANTGAALYSIDLITGSSTLIGDFGPDVLMIDIAADNNGILYGHDIASDTLVTIDTADASVTTIGGHGLAANFAQGMGFDRSTNELYATIYTGGGTGQFVRWDTSDGSIDSLFDTSVWGSAGAELTMAIKSPLPQVPAPGALALLGLAGLAGVRRRRA